MICIWRYWAGENGIFYVMFSHAKFEPPQHSLTSMTLLDSSCYLKKQKWGRIVKFSSGFECKV